MGKLYFWKKAHLIIEVVHIHKFYFPQLDFKILSMNNAV